MSERVKLEKGQALPCPFCGGLARATRQDPMPPEIPADWWTVECPNIRRRRGDLCSAAPMATGDSLAEALGKWNTRKGGAA